MARAATLCFCLLIPTLTSADPLKAIAISQILPLILGFLLVGLALLVAGFFISRADFRSPRNTPGLLVILAILFAFIGGVLISGFFFAIENKTTVFPNILTELYVPVAVLLIFLKQLRLKPTSSAAVFWMSVIAACILVLVTTVASSVAVGDSHHESGKAIMLELFFTLIVWFILFKRLDKWRITANTKLMANAWLIPVTGSVVAILYKVFLYTTTFWVRRSEWEPKFLPEQAIRLLLYCAFGFLVMAATIWISPTQQPKPQE